MSEQRLVPKRRFKGFEGEWEEVQFGSLAEIVRGASPRPIQDPKWFDESSDIGWLRISDVTVQDGRIHNIEQKLRSEEHTSELQSRGHLVCRLLLEKKKKQK